MATVKMQIKEHLAYAYSPLPFTYNTFYIQQRAWYETNHQDKQNYYSEEIAESELNTAGFVLTRFLTKNKSE